MIWIFNIVGPPHNKRMMKIMASTNIYSQKLITLSSYLKSIYYLSMYVTNHLNHNHGIYYTTNTTKTANTIKLKTILNHSPPLTTFHSLSQTTKIKMYFPFEWFERTTNSNINMCSTKLNEEAMMYSKRIKIKTIC